MLKEETISCCIGGFDSQTICGSKHKRLGIRLHRKMRLKIGEVLETYQIMIKENKVRISIRSCMSADC